MLATIRSTLKNSIIYGLGNLSTKLVGFILVPLYTKHLPVADYGVLSILEISSQVLIALFGLGIYQAFFRFYWDSRFEDRKKSIFFTTIVSLTFISAMMIVFMHFFSVSLSRILLDNSDYAFIFRLMVISAGIDIIIQSPNTLIRLQEKPVLFTTANIFKLAVSLGLTVIFIVVYHQKLEGIYKAQIIGQIIYLLVLSKFMVKNITPFFEKLILKEMLIFALPLALSSIAAIVLNISDRYFLKFFGGLDSVGIYSLGYKMSNTINVFIISSVNLAVSPIIFKMMDSPGHHRFYSKIMTYYAFGIMFFILGMSFFGKEIIKVLVKNRDYWDSYKVIPFLSFSAAFIVMKDTAMTGLLKMKKSRMIAGIIISVSVLNILFDVFLIRLFKTYGAAISALLTQISFFILVFIFSQKTYRIPYEVSKLFKIILLGGVLIIISQFLNDLPLLLRLISKSSLIILFPVILYYFRFYETIELERLNSGWIKWRNPMRWKENMNKMIK